MTDQQRSHIAYWLFSIAFILIVMIVLGGVTRLTGSGLSMVQWKPIMGILPPLNPAQWAATFDLYQASPEFTKVNQTMTLAGFKSIFWFEYFHRLLGRLIGLLFFFPMVFFFIKYPLSGSLKYKLLGLFVLGGAQGLLGWYMVQSGLVDKPHVSQYRLVAHLSLALLLYVAIIWIALGLNLSNFKQRYLVPKASKRALAALIFLALITIIAGGFVAGIKAGFAFNTFPLMNGRLVPEGYLALSPWWINAFENGAAVQFNHRLLATVTGLVALIVAWRALQRPLEPKLRWSFKFLILTVGLQYSLGLMTLLLHVPVALAAAHQAGAILFLTACIYVTRLSWARVMPESGVWSS